jgi:hypothetical protein
VALAGIFVSACAIGVYAMGTAGFVAMSPLQAWVILSGLAISAGVLIQSLVSQISPGSRHRFSATLLPAGIVIVLAMVVSGVFPFQNERHFWERGWMCLRLGTPISVLTIIPFWLVLRRGAILSPVLTGAAAGLLAGLVGTSVLEIHCPNLDASHRVFAHLGVAVLCSLLGLALGFVFELAYWHFTHKRGLDRFSSRNK